MHNLREGTCNQGIDSLKTNLSRTPTHEECEAWWGYSKIHGFIVLDRSVTINKPGFPGDRIFIRCKDTEFIKIDLSDLKPPNFIHAPNFFKTLHASEKKDFEIEFTSYINRWDEYKAKIDSKYGNEPLSKKYATPHLENSVKLKDNWKLFDKLIKDKKIPFLFHFTDRSNYASIIKYKGLYSWKYMRNNGISFTSCSNDESKYLDEIKSIDQYVKLSFTPNHPMFSIVKREQRINNPILLKIKPDIIFLETTMFSDRNATSANANLSGSFDFFSNLPFNLFKKTWKTELEKQQIQSEILVLDHVPLDYIITD